MSIPFKILPAGIRTPGMYAELDASQANTASATQRTLIIGQITSAATLLPNVPVRSASAGEARVAGGAGSILSSMVYHYRKNDAFGEVWYLPVADDPTAVAATGTIAITGPSQAAGVISLYVAGRLIAVPVALNTTASAIATAIAAAITAMIDLPVTAAANATNVTLTAKNAGAAANGIDIRTNYRGAALGEITPAGVGLAITQMTGGVVNPSLSLALAALGNLPFDFIVSPYTDVTSMAAITALLSDVGGRWSPTTQIYGHCFTALRRTQGQLAAFGTTLNDQHTSCMGFYDSPTPNWGWAAALAGAVAPSVRADPATPLQTLTLAGVLAPPVQSQFLPDQRNALLYDGIATFTVDPSGAVHIDRLITTYQTNALGQADNSYLDSETMFTLMAVLRAYAALMGTKFARVKLGTDGTRYPAGANVVTPSTIRAELVALYRTLETDNAWVQNSDAFAAAVSVQPNAASPGRVDVLLPIIVIGQLREIAMLVQFKLS